MRNTGHWHAGLRRRVRADDARRSTRRKLLIALGASALAAPLGSFAQQQRKVWRIGFLNAGSPATSSHNIDAFRQGLRELGYIEGQNIVIETRWAEGNLDRLQAFAVDLTQQRVDVIVAGGTPGLLPGFTVPAGFVW
jgi:putative ABC transport system substrate-binding protein